MKYVGIEPIIERNLGYAVRLVILGIKENGAHYVESTIKRNVVCVVRIGRI